jgi:hypothetical protein
MPILPRMYGNLPRVILATPTGQLHPTYSRQGYGVTPTMVATYALGGAPNLFPAASYLEDNTLALLLDSSIPYQPGTMGLSVVHFIWAAPTVTP